MWSCHIFKSYFRFSLTRKCIMCNCINCFSPLYLLICALPAWIFMDICVFFCHRIFKNLTWILPATPRSLRIKSQSKTKASLLLLPRKMLMPGFSVSITAANLVFISSNIWWVRRLRQTRSWRAHQIKVIFRMWPWKKEIKGPSVFLTLLSSPHLPWRVKERRVHCRSTCRSLSLEMVSMTVKGSRACLTDSTAHGEETPPPATTGTWSLGRSCICSNAISPRSNRRKTRTVQTQTGSSGLRKPQRKPVQLDRSRKPLIRRKNPQRTQKRAQADKEY